MNPWYELFITLFVYFTLFVGVVWCIIVLTKDKNKKKIAICFVLNIAVGLFFSVFIASHSTTFKYNDWTIVGSSIYTIEQKYGPFDLGQVEKHVAGEVGYYIYTDNGPIMPDYLKHYYYMRYDEWGVIYEVYDSCKSGG